MSTPEETEKHLDAMAVVVREGGPLTTALSDANAYFERMASELVAVKARADAAEQREREAGEAVLWFLTGVGIGLKFGGDMSTPAGLLTGLIEAHRKAEK